jgi:hypothetical protein
MHMPGFAADASLYRTSRHYRPSSAGMQVTGRLSPDSVTMAQQLECCSQWFQECSADPNCSGQVRAIFNQCNGYWADCHALDVCDSCWIQPADQCSAYLVCDGAPFAQCPNFWAYNDWSCECNPIC